MFSMAYQAIFARILPIMKVKYTSPELHSQIYIGAVNWFLFLALIFIMFEFKTSASLASAYGLAVTGNLLSFFLKGSYFLLCLLCLLL